MLGFLKKKKTSYFLIFICVWLNNKLGTFEFCSLIFTAKSVCSTKRLKKL